MPLTPDETRRRMEEGGPLVAALLELGAEKLGLAAMVLREIGHGAQDEHEVAAGEVGGALDAIAAFMKENGE